MTEELKAQIKIDARNAANAFTGYEITAHHGVFIDGYIAGATLYAEWSEHWRERAKDFAEVIDKKDARIKELEEALKGFIEDVEFHPSHAAMEHYKPLVIKGKAALNSKSNG